MAKGAVRINLSFAPEIAATLQWMSEELQIPMSSILSSGLVYTIQKAKEAGDGPETAETRFFQRAHDFLQSQYGPPQPVFVQADLFAEADTEE